MSRRALSSTRISYKIPRKPKKPRKYRGTSKVEAAWLSQLESLFDITIEKGRRFKRYTFDGYYEEEREEGGQNKWVFELHGDLHHGNPLLYDPYAYHPSWGGLLGGKYLKTLEREKVILESGYRLFRVWEHEFRKWRRMRRPISERGLPGHEVRISEIDMRLSSFHKEYPDFPCTS